MEELENLGALLALKGNYHNHKETMAHAAVAIQIAILIAIISTENLPVWFRCSVSKKVLFSIIYFVIWGIITCYMYWQLWNRRSAAKQVNTLVKEIAGRTNDMWLRGMILKKMVDKGGLKKGECIVWILDIVILITILAVVWCLW